MPTTTLKSPKAAPKKVSAKKLATPKPALMAEVPQVSDEVAALRKAFADYEPDLQILPPKMDYKTYGHYFSTLLPGTKLVRRVKLAKQFIDTGKAPANSLGNTVIDLKTLKKPEPKQTMEALPFWWQVEQGLHPVLPKVPDLAQFLFEWAKDLANGKTTKSVYCGGHQCASKHFRFCEQEVMSIKPDPVVQKYLSSLNCYSNYYQKARFSTVYAQLTGTSSTGAITDPLAVPQVEPSEIKGLVGKAHYVQTSFVVEVPSALEFEDNTEMLARVMEHCKAIPGFKVHYLRKMMVAYTSDGPMSLHPAAFNKSDQASSSAKLLLMNQKAEKPEDCLKIGTKAEEKDGYQNICNRPVIYMGVCWALNFSMLDTHVCNGNMIYFAAWEDFVKTYEAHRPDELAGVPEFSDLVFICSHWCERNSYRVKASGKGIELQTPVDRQLSLQAWICGPFLDHTLKNFKLPGVNSYSGAYTMKKLEVIEAANAKVVDSPIKPRMTPLWAEHFASVEASKTKKKAVKA